MIMSMNLIKSRLLRSQYNANHNSNRSKVNSDVIGKVKSSRFTNCTRYNLAGPEKCYGYHILCQTQAARKTATVPLPRFFGFVGILMSGRRPSSQAKQVANNVGIRRN